MAVGKSGEKADRDRLAISGGGFQITRDGQVVPYYDEAPVVAHRKGQEIRIGVDIGLGKGRATVWTCELTHGYIAINGSYRSRGRCDSRAARDAAGRRGGAGGSARAGPPCAPAALSGEGSSEGGSRRCQEGSR